MPGAIISVRYVNAPPKDLMICRNDYRTQKSYNAHAYDISGED